MELLLLAILISGGYLVFRWMSRLRLENNTMGRATFDEIEHVTDLDALFASSREQVKVLFLHDPWCPISAMASRQVALVDASIATVDVSRQHDLSREIERRTGIRHESPQLILIRDGHAIWDASHASIDQKAINGALAPNAAQ